MALASEFQSGGVLKNPSLRLLLSAEDGSTRVLRDSPPRKEGKKERGGGIVEEVRLFIHATRRISGRKCNRLFVHSNSRVIKFLQFKFRAPPTEKLDVMIYRGWREESLPPLSNSNPVLIFHENFQLPFEAPRLLKFLEKFGRNVRQCVHLPPSPSFSLSCRRLKHVPAAILRDLRFL